MPGLKHALTKRDRDPAAECDWSEGGVGGCKATSSWGAKCGIQMKHTGSPHRFCLLMEPHPGHYCVENCFTEEPLRVVDKSWTLGFGPFGVAPGEKRYVDAMNGGNTSFQAELLVDCAEDSTGLQIVSLFVGDKLQPPPEGQAYPIVLARMERQGFGQMKPPQMRWKLADEILGVHRVTVAIENKSDTAKTCDFALVGKIRSTD